MHIDGIKEIENIDGYKIGLKKVKVLKKLIHIIIIRYVLKKDKE